MIGVLSLLVAIATVRPQYFVIAFIYSWDMSTTTDNEENSMNQWNLSEDDDYEDIETSEDEYWYSMIIIDQRSWS